jgi:hypothetical protein
MFDVYTDDLRPLVVIPVHRPKPTADEQISLLRCATVLGPHPMRIVYPNGLDTAPYKTLLPKALPLPVPKAWMTSISAYNQMMVNPSFYAMFNDYTHLLIHEPDALVLKDELLFWCQKKYDYIGAPWFDGFSNANSEAHIMGVGNSGFSLIRVKAITSLLASRFRLLARPWLFRQLLKKLIGRQTAFSFQLLLQCLGWAGTFQGAHLFMQQNWDDFLFRYSHSADPDFRIAPVSEALLFSWEVNPSICFRLNGGVLPFGIHAWNRYDRFFVENLLQSLSV